MLFFFSTLRLPSFVVGWVRQQGLLRKQSRIGGKACPDIRFLLGCGVFVYHLLASLYYMASVVLDIGLHTGFLNRHLSASEFGKVLLHRLAAGLP